MSQKESEWELKLQEKIKENKFVTPSSHLDVEEIKSFIRETLSNREKEIAEEVEKILERHISWKPTEGYESEEECGFQKGLMAEAKLLKKDLLQILKH